MKLSNLPKLFVGWMVFCLLAGVATTAFVVWVIISLMQHFGVI